MASKRQRANGSWEFTVKRKDLLPKPISLTFDSEEEGIEYCTRLEALLDQGVVPEEFTGAAPKVETLGDILRAYQKAVHLSQSDVELMPTLIARLDATRVQDVTYQWLEDWIAGMKRVNGLTPSTIRKHVGALGRCLHWAGKKYAHFAVNPVKLLPKKYAAYSPDDRRFAAENGHAPCGDGERDRRLEPGEEPAIRKIMAGEKPEGRERPLALPNRAYIVAMFDLALETAMRMREMYTLTADQIDMAKRTIFLDKTKNGDKRQVPLSSVALEVCRRLVEGVENGERVFPWWNGDYSPAALRKVTTRLSQQYARIFDAAGCPDLNFHDLRHEATSRLFERTTLTDVQISRITGHKDPRVLKRYANLRGSDLADALW